MDFDGVFNSINERKEDKHAFWSLIMNSESPIDIIKKVPSSVTFIVFIVFNDSFGVETHIC